MIKPTKQNSDCVLTDSVSISTRRSCLTMSCVTVLTRATRSNSYLKLLCSLSSRGRFL
jgi:hypothetical protein